jgi:cellulose synthase/poly-beta-1,6-N-acetylglucosamine synthase-like glycosyltransferase
MSANTPDDQISRDGGVTAPRVSVIICAYTLERWELLTKSLLSVAQQDQPPIEVILCIDHNHEMYERCGAEFPVTLASAPWPFRVIENRYDSRLGGARTSAAEIATGDVLAFLDDDAFATPSWLRCLTAAYADPGVVAVGGAPIASYESPRPRWFPFECNWIFGCAYRGLPEHRAPIDHVIGANMSIRREALMSWGGFQSDNHDDMDLSHRTIHAYGPASVLYEPEAVVHHFVPRARLTWNYFWRRCYFVNRGKVAAFRGMDQASNLRAELRFARRSLSRALVKESAELLRGDPYAPVRYLALVSALALGGAGAISGRLR